VPTDAFAIAPFILAVVLAVSAVGKLRAPSTSAEAFRDLRVPAPFASRVVVKGLPWAELALGALLVVGRGSLGVVAATAALVLFAAYLALVVRALGFEEPVDCACFGEFAPGRITRHTIVRNVWLLALAVISVVRSLQGPSPLTELAGSVGGLASLGASVAAALTTYLVTAHASPQGEPSPTPSADEAELEDYLRSRTPAVPVLLGDGSTTDLRTLSSQKPQLLLFVSEACAPCVRVIESVQQWREQLPALDIRFVVRVGPGVSKLTSPEEPRTLHDVDGLVTESFETRRTPSALLLGADGLLAGGPVIGSDAVPSFVSEIRQQLEA
jgi:hypothetical protein